MSLIISIPTSTESKAADPPQPLPPSPTAVHHNKPPHGDQQAAPMEELQLEFNADSLNSADPMSQDQPTQRKTTAKQRRAMSFTLDNPPPNSLDLTDLD